MSRLALANTAARFGLVSRLLHWVMAAGVLVMLALGTYIARMEVSLGNLWLFGLHKSIGATLLVLAALRIGWHFWTPPSAPLGPEKWKSRLAVAVHRGVYVLLVMVPVLGWAASAATGLDVTIFGRWRLPAIAPVSETWEAALFFLHRTMARVLLALILLHVTGALMRRDGTLGRMV
jgi:cytochrome b561